MNAPTPPFNYPQFSVGHQYLLLSYPLYSCYKGTLAIFHLNLMSNALINLPITFYTPNI